MKNISFAKFTCHSNSANFGICHNGQLFTGRVFYDDDNGHEVQFDNETNLSPELKSRLTEEITAEYNFGTGMYKIKTLA